jgi:trehalose 6-phosphate phosphatase
VRYFLEKDNSILKYIDGRKIALFLDFDGTLVPIQKDPEQCFLSKKLKNQLLALSESPCCYLIILSGRSLSDIKKRVGIRGLYYGGNHGLDISGPTLRYTHLKALTAKSPIKYITRKLGKEIANIEGAWLEKKIFSVSLHFRSVKTEDIRLVKKVFHNIVENYSKHNLFTIMKGKKVLELLPDVSWDKGKAVLWLLQQLKDGWLPVYAGDDRTDEDAFKALRGKGITIHIGKSKKTSADYYLKGHWELPRLLQQIQDFIKTTEYRDDIGSLQ